MANAIFSVATVYAGNVMVKELHNANKMLSAVDISLISANKYICTYEGQTYEFFLKTQDLHARVPSTEQ